MRTCPGAAGRSHPVGGASANAANDESISIRPPPPGRGPGFKYAPARSSAMAVSSSSHRSVNAWRSSASIACRARSVAATSSGRCSVRASTIAAVQRISASHPASRRRSRASGAQSHRRAAFASPPPSSPPPSASSADWRVVVDGDSISASLRARRRRTHPRTTTSACSRGIVVDAAAPAPAPVARTTRANGGGVTRRYAIAIGRACGMSSRSIPSAAHARSCAVAAASSSPPSDPPPPSFFVFVVVVVARARDASRPCASACSATGRRQPPAATAYVGSNSSDPAAASKASSLTPRFRCHRVAASWSSSSAARFFPRRAFDGGFPRAKTASHARDDPGASGHRSASLSRPRRSVSARPILRRIDDARTPYASPGGGDGTPDRPPRSVVISAVVELPAVNALLPPARASPPRSS